MLATLAACGSAVDVADHEDAAPASVASSSSEATDRQVIARYNAHYDMATGQFTYTPVTALQDAAHLFFQSSDSAGYLAAQTAVPVVLDSGWNSHVYDVGSNRIYLYSGVYDDSDSRGGCLHLSDASQAAHQLRVELSLFSPTSVFASQGAVSTGSGYYVDFGDQPAGGMACRPFSITNAAGTSFQFSVAFTAATLDKNNPSAYVSYAERSNWVYDGTGTGSMSGSVSVYGGGFGNGATDSASLTMIDTGAKNPTDLFSGGYYSNNGVVKTPSSFYVQNFAKNLPEGFFVGNAQGTNVTGPYVMQSSAVKGSFKTASGTLSGGMIWLVGQVSACASPIDESSCTNASDDRESNTANVAFTTFPSTRAMNYINPSITGNRCIYIFVDENRNGSIDAGEHYSMVPGVTLNAGQTANLGSVTLNLTVTLGAICGGEQS